MQEGAEVGLLSPVVCYWGGDSHMNALGRGMLGEWLSKSFIGCGPSVSRCVPMCTAGTLSLGKSTRSEAMRATMGD